MGKRRDKLQINMEILKALEIDDYGITHLFYVANLNYQRAKKHLARLIKLRLVFSYHNGNRVKYKLTNKGNKVLKEYKKIERYLTI